jgi:hypothetical protein
MADATKVLATRDFLVKTAPWASGNAIPADTIVWGGAWGGTWVDKGYTSGGLDFAVEIQRADIRVDQELDPVLRPATGRNMSLQANLAEFSTSNIKDAAGQGTETTVAAVSGTRGHVDLDISSTITDTFLSVGFDILMQDLEAFRIVAWKTMPGGGIRGQVRPTEAATIQLQAQCFPDTSTSPARILKIRDVTAALP